MFPSAIFALLGLDPLNPDPIRIWIHNTGTHVHSCKVTGGAGRPGRPVPPPRPAQSRSAPGSRPAPPAPPSYNIQMLTPPSRVADPVRIRIVLGLPDLLVRGTDPEPDTSIIKKNSKKNLDSYCFVTSLLLFIFGKLFKCLFKKYRNKQNTFCCRLESQLPKIDPEPEPDPLVRGKDPRIWIRTVRTKMSRNRNTASKAT